MNERKYKKQTTKNLFDLGFSLKESKILAYQYLNLARDLKEFQKNNSWVGDVESVKKYGINLV